MGLSWQQGPLAPGTTGRFLVPGPLPERMLFAGPLRVVPHGVDRYLTTDEIAPGQS